MEERMRKNERLRIDTFSSMHGIGLENIDY